MDASPAPTFTQFFKRNFKRILDYWSQITVTLGFLGAGLAIYALYAYTRAIGRTDLFLAGIDAKSVLAIWLLLIVAIMLGYLVVLSSSACFYGLTVSMFEKVPKKHNRIASWLLVPFYLGFCAFTVLLFMFSNRFSAESSMAIVFLVTEIAYFALFLRKPFRKIFNKNTKGMNAWKKNGFRIFIGLIIVFAVFFASLPALLIISTYVGEDTPHALVVVGSFCLGTLVFSLIPVFIFYISKGHVYTRMTNGFAAALVLFCGFLLLWPSAMPSITYAAAGKLAIRQPPARFILDENISLSDVDNRQWQTRLNEKQKVEVTAFPLFAFGDILLLCSRDLQRLNLYDLPRYTRLCIATRNSKVTQKPLRPGLAPLLSWQQRAEHVVGWDHLRSAILKPIHLSPQVLQLQRRIEQLAEPVKTVIPYSAN
ncbi:hypothetical protein QIW46_09485 [Pseudomonas fluorescens]|jgi:hypothetical protein|uniref:Transmembrane protein n=1 Tax=Pseudomonas fluorescens TaxID=294 RepID=A0A423NZV1_PSEFL|nr:hypothetical protein [Pseudomonas fluorescens]ROO03855.1 hypothetical protein BK673_24570 [Pseudomonas fluorescens]